MSEHSPGPAARPHSRFAGMLGSVGLLSLLTASFGCAQTEAAGGGFPGAEERERRAIPVEEVAASDPAAEFTDVIAMDVDSRGRVYVGDFHQKLITVLGPDGKLLRTVGRKGSGPGEMQSVRGVQILPGDSLLMYDPGLARVTVFAPDSGRAAYTVNLAPGSFGGEPFYLWRTRANRKFVAYYRPAFQFGYGDTGEREDEVGVLELDGTPRGKRLLSFPSSSYLVASNSITPNPFGREGVVGLDSRDRLHYVWTDSLTVETYDLAGTRLGSFSAPLQPPAVSEEDVRQALEEMGGEWGAKMFGPTLRDSLPERWPAVADMVVDDADRVWAGLSAPLGSPMEWAVFSAGGGYLGSVLVPKGFELRVVRGDRIHGVRKDESGVPRVVVLRMERRFE